MKRSFGFVNIAAGSNRDVLVDVKNNIMVADYNIRSSEEAWERKATDCNERL